MSSSINAFPIPGIYNDEEFNGMTLRDYFAAKELSKIAGASICDAPEIYAQVAEHCYRMADAMLEARK